ncbi:YciI family protein [Pseudaestuariivita sp.]|uniref:YciI family protein n=1 Tax=Pseudaestuariivita sp. TaxID=2211669 RepID=UPI004057D604
MLVALTARDKPGALDLRLSTREAHVAYLKADGSPVQMAGPLLDAEGQMCGSLIILKVADMAAAQAFAEGDPYAQAGLFESVKLDAWNRVIG